jgi:DSF synthase
LKEKQPTQWVANEVIMDRLSGQLDRSDESRPHGRCVHRLWFGDEHLSNRAATSRIDRQLFELAELDVLYRPDDTTLWTFMRPGGRPSFTPSMLHDFRGMATANRREFGPGQVPLRYLVLGSRAQGVFCFGETSRCSSGLIRSGDRDGLARYGYRCVEILHRNMHSLDLPMLPSGWCRAPRSAAGFEALLSFDYIVAERDATFGLPEILFGLFPGMGAHAILSRKLGTAMADRLMCPTRPIRGRDVRTRPRPPPRRERRGDRRVRGLHPQKCERRHPGLVHSRKAMKLTNPIGLSELKRIVDLWADAALQLSDSDLKGDECLTRAKSGSACKRFRARRLARVDLPPAAVLERLDDDRFSAGDGNAVIAGWPSRGR